MPAQRDRPYVQFNFLVDLGISGFDQNAVDGGFQEVKGLSMEVTVSEYRNGNAKENSVRKITGLNKSGNVTCSRGLIGSKNLYDWIHAIRNGDQATLASSARPTVKIHLQNEDHTAIVQTWKLLYAIAVQWSTPGLNAKGTDVAIEELVIAYERLEME